MYKLTSRPRFLIIGVIIACFIAAGTTPDCSDVGYDRCERFDVTL